MKIVFPNLSPLLNKDVKGSSMDFRRMVHVHNGYAIVQNQMTVIVNLREYIKHQCKITQTEDFEELNDFMLFLEGKSFTGEFWNELTKEKMIDFNESEIIIEELHYNKNLVYEEIPSEKHLLFNQLFHAIKTPAVTLDRVSIPFDSISKFTKLFPKELKNDNVLVDFVGKEKFIKISGHKADYIFGLIPLDYDSANELVAFDNMNTFGPTLAAFA